MVSMFVLDDPMVDGTGSTKGIYGWSGYHGTHFWIDPRRKCLLYLCLDIDKIAPI